MAGDGPRFREGSKVRVKDAMPAGHHRTPGYVKGKAGRVEAVYAAYRNPETLAYGGDGLPEQRLYRVGFAASDLWGARHQGAARDTISVDIYEHWLDPV